MAFLEVSLQSHRSVWPAPTDVAGLCLLPWSSLTQAWSCGSCWLGPALVEGTVLACSSRGHWSGPGPVEAGPSGLFLQRLCAQDGSTEVAGSGLVLQRSLA